MNKKRSQMKLFHKIRHSKLAIPLISVIALLVIVGVVVASTVISNVYVSPSLVVTNPAPQPVVRPLVISSPDFTADAATTTGTSFLASVNLSNPSDVGAAPYTGVTVNIALHKVGGI